MSTSLFLILSCCFRWFWFSGGERLVCRVIHGLNFARTIKTKLRPLLLCCWSEVAGNGRPAREIGNLQFEISDISDLVGKALDCASPSGALAPARPVLWLLDRRFLLRLRRVDLRPGRRAPKSKLRTGHCYDTIRVRIPSRKG